MLKKAFVIPNTIFVEVGSFIRFAGVGTVGLLTHFIILTVLVEFAALAAVYASAIGFLVGGIVNYFLNYRYTFRSTKPHSDAMLKFFTVVSLGLILNTLVMFAFTEHLSLHYLLAQTTSTGLTLIWSFSGNRLWTFRAALNVTKE